MTAEHSFTLTLLLVLLVVALGILTGCDCHGHQCVPPMIVPMR